MIFYVSLHQLMDDTLGILIKRQVAMISVIGIGCHFSCRYDQELFCKLKSTTKMGPNAKVLTLATAWTGNLLAMGPQGRHKFLKSEFLHLRGGNTISYLFRLLWTFDAQYPKVASK